MCCIEIMNTNVLFFKIHFVCYKTHYRTYYGTHYINILKAFNWNKNLDVEPHYKGFQYYCKIVSQLFTNKFVAINCATYLLSTFNKLIKDSDIIYFFH